MVLRMIQPLLFRCDAPAGNLLGGVMGFVGQHLLFRAPAAPALLAAEFFEPGSLGLLPFLLTGFEFIQQELKGENAVESLLACGLALHLKASRTVEQHHTGRRLVDILATVSTRTDEALFDFGFAHAQRRHALRKLFFVPGDDRVHADTVTTDGDASKIRAEPAKRLDLYRPSIILRP